MEESPKINSAHRCEIGFGIINKLLGDENTGVVDQGVDSSEPLDGAVDDAFGSIAGGDVAVTTSTF